MFKKPKHKIFLAPLAGINDPAFRLMCEREGAGITFTELTSIDFIYTKKYEALNRIQRSNDEKYVGLQLFGKHPEKIKDALEVIDNKFEFIDFNAGCPANNIIGQGAGADLLGKTQLLKRMLQEIINNTNQPVTLKYRLGINETKENYLKIGKYAEDIGISMITLHSRYANQGYSGNANWDKIKELKSKVNIPVTGNGDITTPMRAKKMFDETNCDYAMIGRWAMGNPWCFKQTNSYLDKGDYVEISPKEKLKGFLTYLNDAKKYNIPLSKIKIHAMYFTKGIVNGAHIREKIANAKIDTEVINIIKDHMN